jgi:hypothetical protein
VYVSERGSTNQGVIELGAGNDRIVVQNGSGDLVIGDFKAGAGSEDVIDLSAFHTSFSKLLKISTWDGTFLHIDFGRTDIYLFGVNTSALHIDDFLFA